MLYVLIFITIMANGITNGSGSNTSLNTGPIWQDQGACMDAGQALLDQGAKRGVAGYFVCAATRSN